MPDLQELKRAMIEGSGENPISEWKVVQCLDEIKRKRGELFALDDREKEKLQLESLRQFRLDLEREKRRQQEAAFAKLRKDAAIAFERMAISGGWMMSGTPKRTPDPLAPLATRPQGATPKCEAPSGKRRLRLKD